MTTPTTRLVVIPFSGFYDSLHSSSIDDAVTSMFSDRDTGGIPNEGLEMALFRTCDYGKVYTSYAAAYAESLADALHIPSLKFESLNSPREYNFTTDRIFCTVSQVDLRTVCKAINMETFKVHAKEQFTSRDGFISSYSPEVALWGPSSTWDHNQLGCLIQVYADDLLTPHGEPEFNHWGEYGLMDDYRCNGYLDSWIGESTPDIQRLYNIHDYLETRAARA